MRGAKGRVRADGSSALPEGLGLHDMATLGENTQLSVEMEEMLHGLYEANGVADGQKLKAKYKLELVVGSEGRSAHRPFAGMLLAWTNEGYAHGGGDEVIYFCPAKTERNDQTVICGAPLDLRWVGKDVVVCPSCKQVSDPEDLTGQIFAKLPLQHWATLLLKLFERLGFDADIRVKTIKHDLRKAVEGEQVRNRGGDLLTAARAEQEWVIYPLTNILKDTAAGADLYARIKAFLAA